MATEYPTFASPGVSATEIDLTAPTPGTPVGVPAGVIGTSNEGPAFVPVTVANFNEYSRIFGASDGEKFGPLAVYEWLRNAQACTFLRVLGAGDGKKRSDTTGAVTYGGFTVGNEMVQDNGNVGTSKYAYSQKAANAVAGQNGTLGRTYFMGHFASESLGSTIFSEAGIQSSTASRSVPIIRGVLLAPSGVVLTLSGNHVAGSSRSAGEGVDDGLNTPVAGIAATGDRRWPDDADGYSVGSGPYGALTGSVDLGTQEFTMILCGHIDNPTNAAPNVITASFELTAPNYFGNVFNTDPLKIGEKGHLLYSRFDIHPDFYTLTGSGIINPSAMQSSSMGGKEDDGFITTGSMARATYGSNSPNYESFNDRFTTALTPWIVSQAFGGKAYKLFRIHSIDDGADPTIRVKVSIENLKKSSTTTSDFGTFDLIVRKFLDSDRNQVKIEEYRGLSLDPSSDRFVARIIGDQDTYFDFDRVSSSQRLVVEGDFPVRSDYIRVEQSPQLKVGEIPGLALPFGNQGYSHLITSGSLPLTTVPVLDSTASPMFQTNQTAVIKRSVTPPVPYRESLSLGQSPNQTVGSQLYWGIQTVRKTSVTEPNKPGVFDDSIYSFTKFYPDYHPSQFNFTEGDNAGAADSSGTVRDCDRFNNNLFTLERIRVVTGSDGLADVDMWASASYIRQGSIAVNAAHKYRAFKLDDLKNVGNRKFVKFTVLLQGGFDGTDIFNKDKSKLLNTAVKREMDDSGNQGGTDGPTVSSYRKAVTIMGEKSDVDIKLLAIPGLRHESVTDFAMDAIENRFDAMYIMDLEERDTVNTVVTASIQNIDVTNTVSSFLNRGLDTSFAAAYFPDVVMTDPTTRTNVRVPPSVSVLGAFALNDSIGYPWYAPAGFTRGALGSSLYAMVDLNKTNMDDLYEADINPITDFPGTGLVVFGQKTLLAAQSALDRVNVRRLLINVRRSVRAVANRMLFEPNREETLNKFSSLVNPILQSVQERSGVDRFKVIIDTTTTTQADIENNTVRGKIFLQPTRTAEFIALDFVLTNTANFENV